MEHMHLVVNLANESANENVPSVISNTGVSLKINKALLISKRDKLFFNEEFYKYAIELNVNGVYWVVFRRYSEVREEHERMSKKYPALKKESFPPRNPFNKTDTFQMERQQKLEQYLKNYILAVLGNNVYDFLSNYKTPGSPDQSSKMTKEKFTEIFNFFLETSEDILNVQKLGWKSNDS